MARAPRFARCFSSSRLPATARLVTGCLLLVCSLAVWTCRLDRLLSSSSPTVTVTLAGDTVGIADSGMLVAKVVIGGVPKAGYRLTWSSSDPAVATVDSQGRVRGLARGSATVTAELARTAFTAAPVRGTGTVRVVVPRLIVAPGDTTITSAGDTLCPRWAARDARGTTLPGVNPDSFRLTVDADSTLRLIAAGCVVARKSGAKATVRAAIDTATATAGVTVSQQIVRLVVHPDTIKATSVSATVQLRDSAFDRRDSLIASPVLAWTSDDAAVATVDAAGQVTSRGNGATRVRVSGGGKMASVYVVVRQVTRRVTVSPQVDTLRAPGARRTMRAVAQDSLGQPIPDAAFSWASLAPNTVLLVASGVDTATFQAMAEGGASVDVRGTAGGNVADTLARLEVRFTLTTVTIAPKQPMFSHVGDTLRFTATGRDANGATITNASVIWSSSDTFNITIDSVSGLATARDSGSALIRGRHDASVQDTTTASVKPPVLDANTAAVLDTALRGSTTPVVTTRNVQNLGTVNLGVKARRAQSSAWLTVTPDTLTLMPNETKSLQLSADPTGLADGLYRDTVVLQSVGAVGTPKRIPVALLVYCPVVLIAPDTLVTSSITTSSCRSRERPTSYAVYYGFAGSVSDTISVAMSAGGMDSYLYLLNSAGAVIASNDDCSSFTRNACIIENAVLATGSYTIEATTFSTATGAYTLVLSRLAAPSAATGLTQGDSKGPIAGGGTTGSTSALLGATGHDPNPHDTLRLEVEVKPTGTAFDGTMTDSSPPAPNVTGGVTLSVSHSGLITGTSYHWRARACDQTRRCGPWTTFSPDPAFSVNVSGPVLIVTPASLRDSAIAGSSTPIMKSLTINNTGSGTFTWTSTHLKAWLSLPASGSQNTMVSVTLNPTGLTAGTYADTVVITASGAPLGSPDTSIVTFVIQQPVLVVSPASINHSVNANSGATLHDTLHISNSGTGPLTWTATKDSSWVTFDNAANGSAPSSLALTITPGARQAGTYTAHDTIKATGANGSPAIIPVTLTVYQPVLAVSPASVTDSANFGTTATQSAVLNITNTSGGTLTWSATASPGVSWLSGPPSSGSAPGSVTLTLNPSPSGSPLAAGTYNTTVVVTSPEANNSPINVPVQFRVPQPVLSVTPGSISDTATLGVSPTKTATLTVANGDGGVLAWRDSAAQQSSWLGLSPSSAIAPGTITVSLNPANLKAGMHKDTVIVTSPGATGSPARVPVQFNILRPPELPTGLGQFKSDTSTVIPIGGVTDQSVVTFKATVTDLDAGDMLKIQVEVERLGTNFTNTATATSTTALPSGSVATAAVGGLADDSAYHWQVRTCDQTNRCSGWVSFGGNAETAADFFANPTPETPAAPTNLQQFQADSSTSISTRGHTGGLLTTTVVLKATVTDPDPGDLISIQVQVTGGANTYSATGSAVSSGNVSIARVTGILVGTALTPISYTWKAQACDQTGRCSAFVSHGGSPDFLAP